MAEVLQKDRDVLVQTLNDSCLGYYFPREINGLVVDYAVLTVVYDILLEFVRVKQFRLFFSIVKAIY